MIYKFIFGTFLLLLPLIAAEDIISMPDKNQTIFLPQEEVLDIPADKSFKIAMQLRNEYGAPLTIDENHPAYQTIECIADSPPRTLYRRCLEYEEKKLHKYIHQGLVYCVYDDIPDNKTKIDVMFNSTLFKSYSVGYEPNVFNGTATEVTGDFEQEVDNSFYIRVIPKDGNGNILDQEGIEEVANEIIAEFSGGSITSITAFEGRISIGVSASTVAGDFDFKLSYMENGQKVYFYERVLTLKPGFWSHIHSDITVPAVINTQKQPNKINTIVINQFKDRFGNVITDRSGFYHLYIRIIAPHQIYQGMAILDEHENSVTLYSNAISHSNTAMGYVVLKNGEYAQEKVYQVFINQGYN